MCQRWRGAPRDRDGNVPTVTECVTQTLLGLGFAQTCLSAVGRLGGRAEGIGETVLSWLFAPSFVILWQSVCLETQPASPTSPL